MVAGKYVERINRWKHYILIQLHFLIMLILLSFSEMGWDMGMYMSYALSFISDHSAGGSYGPLFYAIYIPIYGLYSAVSSEYLGLLILSLPNILAFVLIDVYIWKFTHDLRWLIIGQLSTPLFYGVSIYVDQRNDIIITLLMIMAIYYFSRDRPLLASSIIGFATAIKWVPVLLLAPYFVNTVWRSSDRKILFAKMALLSISPLLVSTLILHLLHYVDILNPYTEHLYRDPQGNNFINLLFQLGVQTEYLNPLSVAFMLVFFLILFLFSFRIRHMEIDYEWILILGLCFMMLSKVTNNQYMIWVYYSVILAKRIKHVFLLQIYVLFLHFKAWFDHDFEFLLTDPFYYSISLGVMIIIIILQPLLLVIFYADLNLTKNGKNGTLNKINYET
ncbi:MAG: DUF2029 domain-containing protein [Candidatus Heimdallarchaeota archaeon]|nr:DUF2029 domain-containing protein [Candidatus Heimdallarchaeota archaeon]